MRFGAVRRYFKGGRRVLSKRIVRAYVRPRKARVNDVLEFVTSE